MESAILLLPLLARDILKGANKWNFASFILQSCPIRSFDIVCLSATAKPPKIKDILYPKLADIYELSFVAKESASSPEKSNY